MPPRPFHFPKQPELIIDTDGGCDDAMAMLVALKCKHAVIRAVTTVFGNVSVKQATENVCTILRVFDRTDIPVYEGASTGMVKSTAIETWPGHGLNGLGDATFVEHSSGHDHAASLELMKKMVCPEHAAQALINLVKAQPGKLSIVTLGPLTNLALALKLDPSIASLIQSVVVMGGAMYGKGNATLAAEFNFYADPEAAHVVLATFRSDKLLVVPWELCEQNGLQWSQFDQLTHHYTHDNSTTATITPTSATSSKPQYLPHYNGDKMQFDLTVDKQHCYLQFALDVLPAKKVTVMDIYHTFVPPTLRGRNLGGVLCDAAFAHAKREGWKVRPSCSYVSQSYVPKHPEAAALVYDPKASTATSTDTISNTNTATASTDGSSTVHPHPHFVCEFIKRIHCAYENVARGPGELDKKGRKRNAVACEVPSESGKKHKAEDGPVQPNETQSDSESDDDDTAQVTTDQEAALQQIGFPLNIPTAAPVSDDRFLFTPCDAYTMACFLYPHLITSAEPYYSTVQIEGGAEVRGMLLIDWYHVRVGKKKIRHTMTLVKDINKEQFFQILLDTTKATSS